MGKTQRQIAEQINVNQSAISREIVRNSGISGYVFKVADEKAIKRRSSASRVSRKMHGALERLILERLHLDGSPEQISGRLKLQRIGDGEGDAVVGAGSHTHLWPR